jgi:hypothetical protein
MRNVIFRALGAILGLCAALLTIWIPLLFVFNTLKEVDSASQYGGHVHPLGAVGGSAVVLAMSGILAFLAFELLRFAFRGLKATPPSSAR